ncbi:MAG: DUF1788 domain-containing protein [Oscillospiraceae bacterium]|jgi:hypothetical protein|nr:DUF1788 domain-containing protein [Oscillospiraceae bacterium]
MSNIDECLDKVRKLLKNPDFLEGNGLSNEVNIWMFCYEAKDEMRVRHFVNQIMADQTLPCHLIENNLYEIFLSCCEDKRILSRMSAMEEKKGKDYLQKQIEKAVTVQAYVDKICARQPEKGDVILLTGVGDIFPFMRIHMLLEALQPRVGSIPILVMYPGKFDGRYVKLFNRLPANPYYRAFNVIQEGTVRDNTKYVC